MSKPYLVATRNPGKLQELRDIFASHGIRVIDLTEAGLPEASDEDSIESWDTFEENALGKAQYFYRRSGLPTFADDSGLSVDALGGRPGVRSKRFSGRTDLSGKSLDAANNAMLLAQLRRMNALPAAASFVCAAAFADRDRAIVRTGATTGMIVPQPRGTSGFGYDPHFISDELKQTFGEASAEDKERVGHRGRAFRALLAVLSREADGTLQETSGGD